jgi:hypothetical protein
MKPSDKDGAIESVLSKVFGHDRRDSITNDVCVPPPLGCGKPALHFRDGVSANEFAISGLCQSCQDQVFGVEEEA